MEPQRNCVAKRTRSQFDKRIAEFYEEKRKKQQRQRSERAQDCNEEDDQINCVDLEDYNRDQEYRKRKGQVFHEDCGQSSRLDLQKDKRDQEFKERKFRDRNHRSHVDLDNDPSDQRFKERKFQDCNKVNYPRSQIDLDECKRYQETRKIATFEVSSSSFEEDSDMESSSSEEHIHDLDYILDEVSGSVGSYYSSDEDQEVEDHGDEKCRKISYSKHGIDNKCSVAKFKNMGFGNNTNPVPVSDTEASGSSSNSSSDENYSLNCKHRPSSLPSKRGRKKQKLLENPGSVSKQKKPESKNSNGSHRVYELDDSDCSLGVDDNNENVAVTKKRGPKKQKSSKISNCGPKKQKSPKVSNSCSVSTQKNHEFEKANVAEPVFKHDDHHLSIGVDDRKDNPPVTIKDKKIKEQFPKKHGKSKVQGSKKGRDFINILSDTILDNGVENLLPQEETSPIESSLPLKFGFTYEYPVPVEKTEEEKEIDSLFADLAMGLIEEDEIRSTNVQMEEEDVIDVTTMTRAERCLLGHHELILSDTIGKICKYCNIVCQEIHNILPDLVIRTRGRGREYVYAKKNGSILNGLEFDESGHENNCDITNLSGSVLNLIPLDMREKMYLHQKDGYEFLWKHIAGETLIEKLMTPLQYGGTGCIISHAPGTGKSFTTIMFLRTFLNVYPNCRPMIVAPPNMLLTWASEFEHRGGTIPFHNLNDSDLTGKENKTATRKSGNLTKKAVRMIKLYSWNVDGGVLGIGYQLFEKLANNPKYAVHNFRKILLEKPGVVVFDEGHTARNKQSLIWNILTKIKTQRRISLTGTLFQNNFKELHNVLSLVKPGFDQHLVKHCGGGGKKSAWDSLTELLDKNSPIASQRSKLIDPNIIEKLKSTFSHIIHEHKGSILQKRLPGLKDTLIVLKPTNEQKRLLKELPDKIIQFKRDCLECLISVHPSVAASDDLFRDSKDRLKILEHILDYGVKSKVLIEIIRLSIARSEKVLVFCSFLEPLKFILNLLISYFSWGEGKEVFLMVGKVNPRERQSMIERFNDSKNDSKVLLASINACSEGINLVGASRVVLVNVEWNPSKERQAICRAYRLGQTKLVHVYHLIMSETREMEKYMSQAKKDRLSEMVFSSKVDNIQKPDAAAVPSLVSDDMVLDAIVKRSNLRESFERILPQPKEANLFEE